MVKQWRIFLVSLLLCTSTEAVAAIYKWVDENGRTHFSETKPKDSKASDISQQLDEVGNIVEMKQSDPAAFKSTVEKTAKISVAINIQSFDYPLSDNAKNRMRTQVRAVYRAYVDWFGWAPEAQYPVRIKIFGQYQAFIDYQKSNGGNSTHRSHYSPARREVVMLGTEFTESTLGVLLHEVSHAIIHMESNSTPKWIDEGLAEVFEYSRINRGRVKLGSDPEWVEKLKHQLSEGSLKPVAHYLKIPDNQWSKKSRRVERSYYTVAWGLMRFMTRNESNRALLLSILKTRKLNPWWQKPELVQRFDQNYPEGVGQLNSDWRNWIRRL
tara:strand:+ start:3808 stop:4785 length:978 start_codon:yes stop_codon:yes gene_type:complete